MIKIITKSERDLFLRPGVDELFDDKDHLDGFFVALMMEEAEDFINIKLEETAHKYFLTSKNVWYLKTGEENTYLKIELSEFEHDPITEEYLNDLIWDNEDRYHEVVDSLSDIDDQII